MNKKYSILIVGLGRIGFGYDATKNKSSSPRSHLFAALENMFFSEIFGVEVNSELREQIKKKISDPRVSISERVPTQKRFDVAVVSTPSEIREDLIKDIIKCQLKVLIIEKPLSLNLEEAIRIKKMTEIANIEVRVNFHRRFDTQYLKIKPLITEKKPLLILMKYGKGLYNYGLHHIDFLIDWFGQVSTVTSIDEYQNNADTSWSFSCQMKSGVQVVFLGLKNINYDQYEVEIFYEDSQVDFKSGGRDKLIRYSEKNKYFEGYNHLGQPIHLATVEGVFGLENLYNSITSYLDYGHNLSGCRLDDAITGLKIAAAVENSAKTGCLPQTIG